MTPPEQSGSPALGDYGLAMEAALWLGIASLALLILPASRISASLGDSPDAPRAETAQVDNNLARRLSWALGAAAVRLPWHCRCLARAMAGRMMLRRRGLPAKIHLGLAHGGPAGINAHAWLCSGPVVVCGAAEMEHYKSIGAFGD